MAVAETRLYLSSILCFNVVGCSFKSPEKNQLDDLRWSSALKNLGF